MIKKFFVGLLALPFLLLPLRAVAADNLLTITMFWAEGCPHCAAESAFLETYLPQHPEITLQKYEVSKSRQNQQILLEMSQKLNFDPNGVPVTIIGDRYILGFMEGTTEQKIESLVLDHLAVANEGNDEVCKIDQPCNDSQNSGHIIKLPLFGEINTKDFSLPLITAIIGTLDGFNPCSLWVLLFLASLLIEAGNRKKMLIYGGVFILTEALTYALFMTAWLNLLLFIGFVLWFRIAIGSFAIGAGGFNIREWWQNRQKDSGCRVTGGEKRKKIFARIQKITGEEKMILAVIGIIALAFSVNLIEMLCSAGLPAIYTQVLALSHLNRLQYTLYIILYVFFFMIDDFIIFGAALITFSLKGISTKMAKYSHLIGGIIMLILGILLIFKPNWLMFG